MKQNLITVSLVCIAFSVAISCGKNNPAGSEGNEGGFEELVPEIPEYVNANLIYYGNGGDVELPDEWLLNLWTEDMEIVSGNPVGPGQYLCLNFYAPANMAQEASLNYLKGTYTMPSGSGLSECTYIQGSYNTFDTALGSISIPSGSFFGDIPAGQTEFDPDFLREGSFTITAGEDGTWTIEGILVGTEFTKRYFSYTGEFSPVDRSDSGSGEVIENSNLSADVSLEGLTQARLIDNGDFFATGGNDYRHFLLYLAEPGVDISGAWPSGTGRLLHLELFVPYDADPADGIPAGEYTMANRIADGSYMPRENIVPFRVVEGCANVFQYNTGTWYQEISDGAWVNFGRITGGSVTVSRNGDEHSLNIDLTDCGDPARRVYGVWTGTVPE